MTHTLKVGCYGAKGSYTYEAMEQQFGSKEREESYFPLFEDVVKAVKDGTIDYGVLPIENSSTGGITEVYDLIQKYDCAVVGEQLVKIEHNLLGIPGATLDDIDTVYSHPQGFRQCRPFFNEHRDWTRQPHRSPPLRALRPRGKYLFQSEQLHPLLHHRPEDGDHRRRRQDHPRHLRQA